MSERLGLADLHEIPVLGEALNGRPDGPVLVDLRDVRTRNVEWLDRPFLPRGELIVNIATGGTGKGLVSIYYASQLSSGALTGSPVMCVFAVAEDAFDTVVKPRLIAAGADLAYVRALRWSRRGLVDTFQVPGDIPAAEEVIAEAGLFVIDPLLSHLAGKTDSYKDHEVKRALSPLAQLAQRTGCSVLGNLHFGKDVSRGARSAAQGSTAFVDVPRVAWGMAKDPEQENARVLEIIKSNIGPEGIGRNWSLQFANVPGLDDEVPLIHPEGIAERTVDELLRATSRGAQVSSRDIQALILRELASGRKSREHLNAAALSELGASANAVYERGLIPLKDEKQIKAKKEGFEGTWSWELWG